MNLLPLETFRQLIGYHPYHFWGLANSQVPVTSACNDLVKEYAWQGADAVGRSEIRTAIATAEQRLFDYLGYAVAPRYREQTLAYPHLGRTGWYSHLPLASDGRWMSIDLHDGYVQAVGIETRTLIGAAAVTYSDDNNDDVDDTFTLTIATTVTEPSELAVYFGTADRFGDTTLSEAWRIQPVQAAISAGTVTITGPSYLLVKPVLYQGVATTSLDPATASNFVTSLDVYRRYTNSDGTTNATSQALLIWETSGCGGGWWCCGATYTNDARLDPAAQAYALARAGIRDSRLGLVAPGPAAYNSTTGQWAVTRFATGYEPDRLTIRYLAGYPLSSDGQMDTVWQTIVTYLAAAHLTRPICACDTANRTLYYWQTDLARTGGNNDEQFGAISATDLDNPFGTRRGQVYAWRQVRNLRLGQGLLM